ncbi:DUF5753 domain-containing protein [Actinomadura algeriensis]|uniref:DUF5753 domain-containing protein n=1 Tax=Actinomadura algeriensis TaxID=1679523 RepID=UPI00385045B0
MGSGTKADKLDELVEIRMERQKILDKGDPPWLFLVFREAVLRDIRPEVRKAQCERLLDLMPRRTVSIQILPTEASVFVEGAFHLLDFGHGRDVAYVDGAGGSVPWPGRSALGGTTGS